MGNRRHHYERAFESYLRATRTPYVSVNEARRALLPERADLSVDVQQPGGKATKESLKSFDFVIYSEPTNILVEIKGRQIGRRGAVNPLTTGRLENWVTRDDVVGLQRWQHLFNGRDRQVGGDAAGQNADGFASAFVFVYLCSMQPPDALFQEIFEFEGAWYALRMVPVDAYAAHMTVRSPRWGTVNLSREAFERLSTPLAAGLERGLGDGTGPNSGPELGSRAGCGLPNGSRRVSAMPGLQRELARHAMSHERDSERSSLARVSPER